MAQAALNPFDRFDGPSAPPDANSPPKTNAAPNPFDHFDGPKDDATTYGSIARNALAGTNTGIASVAGFPVDATAWAMNKGISGINRIAGRDVVPAIQEPFGGSESIKHGMASIGIPTDSVEAKSTAEKVARGAGEGAGSLVTGAGLVSLGKTAGVLGGKYAGPILETIFGKPDAGTAAVGATTGAGSELAGEIAPEPYKPAARLVGGLIGGAVPLTGRVLYEGGKFAVQAARDFSEPFTQAGQERIAGRTIKNAADNPAAVADVLTNGPGELVPGSKPTTFQQTGDLGLGQLERRVRTQNPPQFIEREASQNAARQDAIGGVQAEGYPVSVAERFRSLRSSLEDNLDNEISASRQRADQTISKLGDGGTAEAHGAIMRGLAQSARDKAKVAERALWDTVDPTGRMVMPAKGIADLANSLERGISGSAKPISGEEKGIIDVAKGYGDSTPFREIMDLRSRVSAEMAAEKRANGFTPVYSRLVQMRGAVETAIDHAVENHAAIEERAVANGAIQPHQTMAARLTPERDALYGKSRSAARSDIAVGDRADAVIGSRPVSAASGAEISDGGRYENASRNQGIQSNPSGIPLDTEAAARLKEASAATGARASTFDRGPVGDVLRPEGYGAGYRVPASAVPAKVFHPGPTGGEDARAFVKAVGERDAIPALRDYAALSLRNAAARPDGTLDPAKINLWLSRHSDALAELPPAQRAQFASVAKAEEAVATAIANRKAQLSEADRSAAAKIMGLHDDGDVVRHVGSMLSGKTAARDMAQLATAARGDPATKDGLRRAVVEYVQSKMTSNAEAGNSGRPALKADQFQTFVRTKSDALAKIFSQEEIAVFHAVANDLQRANRSITATKLSGGSNTPQDVYAIGKGGHSVLGRLVAEAAAAGVGGTVGGLSGGAAGWLGSKVASAFRKAGLERIDHLVTEAMLDPPLARALLQKVPAKPDTGAAVPISARLRQIVSAASAWGSSDGETK